MEILDDSRSRSTGYCNIPRRASWSEAVQAYGTFELVKVPASTQFPGIDTVDPDISFVEDLDLGLWGVHGLMNQTIWLFKVGVPTINRFILVC